MRKRRLVERFFGWLPCWPPALAAAFSLMLSATLSAALITACGGDYSSRSSSSIDAVLEAAGKAARGGDTALSETLYLNALDKALREEASGKEVALCANALLDSYDRADTPEKKRAVFDRLRAPTLDGARGAAKPEDKRAWALLRLRVLIGMGNLERDLGHFALANNLYDKALDEDAQYKQDNAINIKDGVSNLVLAEVDKLKQLQSREDNTQMSVKHAGHSKLKAKLRDAVFSAERLERDGKADDAQRDWKEALNLAQQLSGKAGSDYRGPFQRLIENYLRTKQVGAATAMLTEDLDYLKRRVAQLSSSSSILKEVDEAEAQMLLATDWSLMARILISQGKRQEARNYLVRSIETRERLGRTGPDLVSLNDILLETAMRLSDPDLIARCARRAIELRRRLALDVPPGYVLTLSNALLTQKKYAELEACLEPEVAKMKDPALRLCLIEQLAAVKLQMKKYADVVSITNRAVRSAKDNKLTDSVRLASIFHIQGDALQLSGSAARAVDSYRSELKVLTSLKPPDELRLAHCFHGMGNSLSLQNDLKGAERAYETALKYYGKQPKDSEHYAQCLFDLAAVYRRQGRDAEARKALGELQSLLHDGKGVVSPLVAAQVMRQLADLIRLEKADKEHQDKAARLYKNVLTHLEKHELRGTAEEAAASFELGMLDLGAGKYRSAYQYFARCLPIFEASGDVFNQIGILHRMGMATASGAGPASERKAQEIFTRQLKLHEKVADDATMLNFRAQGHHQLADSYWRTGDSEKAEREYLEALKYYEKMAPPMVLNEGRVLQFLGNLSKARSDRSAATQYYRRAEAKLWELTEPDRSRWLRSLEKDRAGL